MILAQLSDLHINADGRYPSYKGDAAACLEAAVADLLSLTVQPDAVLITGDLVDDGLPAEYVRLRELLAPLSFPVFLMSGNHDAPGPLRAAFPDHRYLGAGDGPVHYVIEDFAVRLIALDSRVAGESVGRLGAEQIAWLDARLAEQPGRPAIVALHHQPFPTGRHHADRVGLEDAGALAAVIRRHPQVERVVSGHVHHAMQTRWAGTLASTVPAACYQLALDLRSDAKGSIRLETPGYHVHHFTPASGIVTSTRLIGPWPVHQRKQSAG
jgi:3',5'-cyclic-AMP phosphodiesterase